MADLLKNAVSWLAERAKSHMATSVQYVRGVQTIDDLKAAFGQTQFEQSDDEGQTISATARDFIVSASDLVLDGQAVTPAVGDQIVEIAGGVTRVSEVLELPNGETWRYADPHHYMMRIHTKEISVS